jgi:hypothetical protein
MPATVSDGTVINAGGSSCCEAAPENGVQLCSLSMFLEYCSLGGLQLAEQASLWMGDAATANRKCLLEEWRAPNVEIRLSLARHRHTKEAQLSALDVWSRCAA